MVRDLDNYFSDVSRRLQFFGVEKVCKVSLGFVEILIFFAETMVKYFKCRRKLLPIFCQEVYENPRIRESNRGLLKCDYYVHEIFEFLQKICKVRLPFSENHVSKIHQVHQKVHRTSSGVNFPGYCRPH